MSNDNGGGENGERVTTYVPEDWDSEVEAQLSYGESKSGWVRDAIRMRLDLINDRDGELSS